MEHTIEESSARLNNLEHFPIEILMRIFLDIDDIGLLNLAITSYRFEEIAKIIFTERYADKYFIIDNESEQQQAIYVEVFSRFGKGIKAIKVIGIRGIDKAHWMTEMLQTHTNCLQKLSFRDCTFKNAFAMLLQHMNITHLTIIGGSCEDDERVRLPKYRNLRKLELRYFSRIMEQSLKWIFLHNPQLESLILRFCGHYFTLPKVMEFVHKHLKQLKEFNVLDHFDFQADFPSNKCIEKFINAIGGLESLGFTIDEEVMNIFQRLSTKCGQYIKNLELYCISSYLDDDTVEIARTFQNVETLSLVDIFDHVEKPVIELIEKLPKLRHLSLSQVGIAKTNYMLTLLRKCENLEQLVLELSTGRTRRPDDGATDFIQHFNANFHGKFLNAKRKVNVEIEFREYGCTVGRVTEDEILWRNKRVHWIGYNPMYSQSKLNLLDLADQVANDNAAPKKSPQKYPFNLILEHLDLTSLYALYKCNERSKRIIDEYVERHAQQHGQFIISDEFHLNYSGLEFFAKYVNNLGIKLFDHNTQHLQNLIDTHYIHLRKLCFRTRYRIDPHKFIFPNVQHYIFYGTGSSRCCIYHCNVTELAEACPHLKTLEFWTDVKLFAVDDSNPQHSFSNLQTFKFKPYNESQVTFARILFEKNGTEIVILD